MSEPLPTKEDWEAWLEMPQTKALRRIAVSRRAEIKNGWEEGAFQTQEKNWTAIGSCKALQMLADLDYEQVIEGELEELENGE